ncbi:hypothetical protein [Alicyclobacillus macrosporangiidus]|jgi:hypothetical protein|uniref:Uncharacterized protein n=1 Tax=Alicyclobacillus macrosporangiidus TaxID=392015 RepID=A0A1I7FUC5_9BACL|nr:hypothetical protein [Alicyclobacillus macrosporangiidus]SFU39771.1 hypothetical protein SAMN05421543_101458 [Alicyclobacillus macrosporangiidus]
MASTVDDIRDVRQRAAAILSGHKLRQLEEVGLAVVDRRRLEALEKVASQAWEVVIGAEKQVGCSYAVHGDEIDHLRRLLEGDVGEVVAVDKRRLEAMER